MARQMPKTGERRKTRQPFAIDKLPSAWRERIIELRAKWMTWEHIEQESTTWNWDELTSDQKKLFAERRIPMTTLHRWYDVQVRQKIEEVQREREASRQIAAQFAKGGYEKLDESVKGAIADVVFGQDSNSSDPERFRKRLLTLGRLLQRDRQLDIAKQRANVEQMKVEEVIARTEKATRDAANKLGKRGKITIDDINRIRERALGLPPIERGASA